MKKSLIAGLLAMAMLVAGIGFAQAQPPRGDAGFGGCPFSSFHKGMPHHGMMGPRMMMQLPPEKQKAYKEIMKAFGPKLTTLHDQFMVKRMELNALSHSPAATPEAISRTANELGAILAETRKVQQEYGERLEKEVGPMPLPPMDRPHGRPGRGERMGKPGDGRPDMRPGRN